jgi:hypothetical protein
MRDYNKKRIDGKTFTRWGEIAGRESQLNTEDTAEDLRRKGYLVRIYARGSGMYEIFVRKKERSCGKKKKPIEAIRYVGRG